ncbi:hypothetical protein, partial [Methanobrevibacter arboriphilus]|uniref:hypothetical protein n=1 Tax=Methanobrevibacter arboriphilus TaxID=39441 RepID=UPI000AABBA00
YNNINNSNIDSNIINKTNHHLDNNKVVNESFNIINESYNNKLLNIQYLHISMILRSLEIFQTMIMGGKQISTDYI